MTNTSQQVVATHETTARTMRLFVTGGTGVLGRALLPLAIAAGHEVHAPTKDELDLFDPDAVRVAVAGADAVVHLATRIRSLDDIEKPELWKDNDRLRIDATRNLVDAALATTVHAFAMPTVTFVYPPDGPADEDAPIVDGPIVHSAIVGEHEVARFAAAGRRGVVLRLGLLDGPNTGNDEPIPDFGATIDVRDAGRALLIATTAPSGIYNVCRDGERVPNRRFTETTGWRPEW